jgi:hypothetical protein
VLGSGDRSSLWNGGAGADPTGVAGANLVWHYSLDGSSPEQETKGGPSLTVTGTPTYYLNPPSVLDSEKEAFAKWNAYAVLDAPEGESFGKWNAYSLISPPDGAGFGKWNAYSIIEDLSAVTLVNQEALLIDQTSSEVQVTQVMALVLRLLVDEWHLAEVGDVVIDGEVDFRWVPVPDIIEVHFDEEGDLAIDSPDDGLRQELHIDEPGAFAIDGPTDFHAGQTYLTEPGEVILDGVDEFRFEVSNNSAVAQIAAEILIQPTAPPIATAAVDAEMLIRGAAPTGVAQVAAEMIVKGPAPHGVAAVSAELLEMGVGTPGVHQLVMEMVVVNWKGKGNFYPYLARTMRED